MHKMSKNNSTEKQSIKENSNIIPQANNTRQYLINFLIFVLALLIGIQIPKYVNEQKSLGGNEFQSQESSVPKAAQPLVDMEKIYKEVSERIRAEISEAQILKEREHNQNSNKAQTIPEKPQDDIINEKVAANTKTVTVSNEIVEDESAIKFQSDGSPVTIDLNKVKNKQAEEEREAQLKKKKIQEAKEKARQAKEKKLQEAKKDEKSQIEKEKMQEDPKVKKEKRDEELKVKEQKSDAVAIPDEIKNFQSTKINQIKTKKMWIPIPGSNGGHRRVPASRINLDSAKFFEYLFF